MKQFLSCWFLGKKNLNIWNIARKDGSTINSIPESGTKFNHVYITVHFHFGQTMIHLITQSK